MRLSVILKEDNMKDIQALNTKIEYITNKDIDAAFLENAAIILRKGGIVAFPTETVYGIGANALDEDAVKKIFVAKGRPSDNPLIVHIDKVEDLKIVVADVPEVAKKLIDKFWAGPLTIILKKSEKIPYVVTAGLETVAIRMPADDIACKFIELAGVPVAAPSANLSGRPSPTCAEHVIEDLSGRVDCIIAGSKSKVGIESTVIDLTSVPPVILRPGFITKEQIEDVIGNVVEIDSDSNKDIPISPGLKYRHYSPKAPLTLFMGEDDNMVQEIVNSSKKYIKDNKKIGIICCDEHKNRYESLFKGMVYIQSLGSANKPETMVENLFEVLRKFDKWNVTHILSESFSEVGIGKALMNRLVKASSGRIVRC